MCGAASHNLKAWYFKILSKKSAGMFWCYIHVTLSKKGTISPHPDKIMEEDYALDELGQIVCVQTIYNQSTSGDIHPSLFY